MTTRGTLRVYLGAAPGVGKTYRMLDEGHRRRSRGTDVVVALVECHGRALTESMLAGLEVVPRARRVHRGREFTELDLDAVLARRPDVALVDELAHTNVPGGRHAKRWQDVEELLAAGIDVITTVNVQHLESLTDVVEKITGVPQRETVPDAVVRRADQIELVDMAPEALRRRMAHGNIYPAERVDAALSHYFRPGNLTALRELALLWVADRVDEGLRHYRETHHISGVWETRERIVVGLTGGPEGGTLIRRAARIAARSAGGDLLAVHVARSDGLSDASPAALAAQRRLVESLGGSYHQVVGDDITAALLDFARAEHATQLVVGTSRRSRLSRLLGGRGIGEATVAASGDIDVHMVTHEEAATHRPLRTLTRRGSRAHLAATMAAALLIPPVVALILAQLRGELNLTSQVLVFLFAVVALARLGGLAQALVASISASLLLNYFFIPPLHTFDIDLPNNALALSVFVVVGLTVASVVDLAARQTRRAARASAEAATLATLAGSVLRGQEAVPALLERSRETFGMAAVALLERTGSDDTGVGDAGAGDAGQDDAGQDDAGRSDTGSGDARTDDSASAPPWRLVAAAGSGPPPTAEAEGDVRVPVGENAVLLLRGRSLPAADQRVLAAFAGHLAVALEQGRLARAAAQAAPIIAADRMRTALLAAVSHDLRTPLASIKAAIGSLRSPDVAFDPEDTRTLLATAEEGVDRLTRLVDNLLDMSRLQAGVLSVHAEPVALDEVLAPALEGLPDAPARVRLPEEPLPHVHADPGLLERVLANLIGNALRHSPPDRPVTVTASGLGEQVEIRVVDRGPGIPPRDRERVFQPFQRLGDRDNATGLGLGLALARGLTEAQGGTLTPEDTPGGGLTMVVALPAGGRGGEG